jgi:tryptophan synthase beta subunit
MCGGAKILLQREELNHTGAHTDQQLHRLVLLPSVWVKKRTTF